VEKFSERNPVCDPATLQPGKLNELIVLHLGHSLRVQQVVILVGNKADLIDQRMVDTNAAEVPCSFWSRQRLGRGADRGLSCWSVSRLQEFAQAHHMPFIETSAKTNTNVQAVFSILAQELMERRYVLLLCCCCCCCLLVVMWYCGHRFVGFVWFLITVCPRSHLAYRDKADGPIESDALDLERSGRKAGKCPCA